MKVEIYKTGEIEDKFLEFAVIASRYKSKWIFVKHKERSTWEIPGGYREKNEEISATGARELKEETGAVSFQIIPMFDYSVERNKNKRYGRVFYAEIDNLGQLPDSEIERVELFDSIPVNLTYQEIQPKLHEEVINRIKNSNI